MINGCSTIILESAIGALLVRVKNRAMRHGLFDRLMQFLAIDHRQHFRPHFPVTLLDAKNYGFALAASADASPFAPVHIAGNSANVSLIRLARPSEKPAGFAGLAQPMFHMPCRLLGDAKLFCQL